ncbi:MAG: cupin domain-containing protein [Candidatus Limnocylindria bacterium]
MRERTRAREPEPRAPDGAGYWMGQRRSAALEERSRGGKIVVTTEDRRWEVGPMGRMYRYIYDGLYDDTALTNWWVFKQDIKVHSGSHRHQGGLIIYVLEGKGYSIVEGVRHDWEAGDLLLLPITPGGVEHQHFNSETGQNAKWVAFIYLPFWDGLASKSVLTKDSPVWAETGKESAVGRTAPPEGGSGTPAR